MVYVAKRTHHALVAAFVATALSALTLIGCEAGAPGPALDTAVSQRNTSSSQHLLLDFEDRAAHVGAVIPAVANAGIANTRSRVITAAGGRIRRAEGPTGGYAIRFPAFSTQEPTPVAVLVVHADGKDFLAPRRRDFAIGLDLRLDRQSAGSATDNGDNLMQRGLFSDPEQFKLQVDGGVLSCRISGRAGTALVKAAHAVTPERWHRVTCARTGDRVKLSVQQLRASGWGAPEVVEVVSATGALRFRQSSAPLAIGGKVTPEGTVVPSSTDQFNGVIDNLRFEYPS